MHLVCVSAMTSTYFKTPYFSKRVHYLFARILHILLGNHYQSTCHWGWGITFGNAFIYYNNLAETKLTTYHIEYVLLGRRIFVAVGLS